MRQQIAVDGFRLAYDRTGQGPRNPAVLLLHDRQRPLTGRIRAAEPRDPRAPLRPLAPLRLTSCGRCWCRT